jgi:hypothetical protein
MGNDYRRFAVKLWLDRFAQFLVNTRPINNPAHVRLNLIASFVTPLLRCLLCVKASREPVEVRHGHGHKSHNHKAKTLTDRYPKYSNHFFRHR